MRVEFQPLDTTGLTPIFRTKPLAGGILAVFDGGARADRYFVAWLMAGELGLPLVQTPVPLAGCVSFLDNRPNAIPPLPGSVVVLSYDDLTPALEQTADLVVQFPGNAVNPPTFPAPAGFAMDRIDANCNFDVVIGGVSYGFSEISPLTCVAYASRGTVYPNIVLRRAVTLDRSLYRWRMNLASPQADVRTLPIQHLSLQHLPTPEIVRTWWIEGAWPVRWTGPSFDAMASRPAMEEIELCISRFDWISGGK